jgi:hypothetical protein
VKDLGKLIVFYYSPPPRNIMAIVKMWTLEKSPAIGTQTFGAFF